MYWILLFINFLTCDALLDKILKVTKSEKTECNPECYRTFDGSYNNLKHPTWGAANIPYGRLLKNAYSDGVHSYPLAKNGRKLPNERELSLLIFPYIRQLDPKWTLLTVMWGQLITHDQSQTAGIFQTDKHSIECCTPDGKLNENIKHDRCKPIIIPHNDPYNYPEGRKCMNFVRTLCTGDFDKYKGETPYEPLTESTSFIDLSVIYGNSRQDADSLRTFKNGQLRTSQINRRDYPSMVDNPAEVCAMKNISQNYCFLTGDPRVNQNPPLTLMQTMFLRKHNTMAKKLCRYNSHWDDERCFQEARKINIAIEQHIHYYEYLPFILGINTMRKKKLFYEKEEGYVNDYNKKVNPTVLNEHATAAFRVFHSTIAGFIEFISQYKSEPKGGFYLSDWLNNPSILVQDNNELYLATGQSQQQQYKVNRFHTPEITQFLFKSGDLGSDLKATDIARGRDHGLDSYAAALEKFGLCKVKKFEDFERFIKPRYVDLLKRVYDHPEDVDLVVGGALEEPVPGALTGPTFNHIMAEHFYRSRVGDRFFFENSKQPCPFTPEQLQNIREVSKISIIVCNNVDGFQRIQENGFEVISEYNKVVDCSDFPDLDLKLWKE